MTVAWTILYDDGRTPKIHMTSIRAENMSQALLKFSERVAAPNTPFACVLAGHEGVAGAVLAKMNMSTMTVEGRH